MSRFDHIDEIALCVLSNNGIIRLNEVAIWKTVTNHSNSVFYYSEKNRHVLLDFILMVSINLEWVQTAFHVTILHYVYSCITKVI